MNIAIDIDDTITYTYETLIPMIASYYGINLKKLMDEKPNYATLNHTLKDYDKFKKDYYGKMARMVKVKEKAVEVINRLHDDGHRIVFMSARNNTEYDDPYQISKDYLDKMGIKYDKLLVNVKDKGKACILENIDLFIDDSTKNCKAVQSKGIKTLQFDTVYTKDNKYLRRVMSWPEVLEFVNQMVNSDIIVPLFNELAMAEV